MLIWPKKRKHKTNKISARKNIDEKILTFGFLELKKINFTTIKLIILWRCRYLESISM